jgi:ataxin-3
MINNSINNNKSKNSFKRGLIYFEKQSDDRLCGLHCINSLLQGPYFNIIQLSEIGMKLDEEEQKLFGKNYTSHNNVDDSGNYNIQVLTKALNIYNCKVDNLKRNEAISLLEKQKNLEALIFNSSSHWFAIRKIDGIWFNLNSTNSFPGPEIISEFYLSAFIQGTEDAGYTNFLIKNLPKLPDLNSEIYDNLLPYQNLVKYEDIINANKSKNGDKDEEENKNKFKPFTGKGYIIDNQYANDIKQIVNYDDEDEEMKQAYKLSLIEYSEQLKRQLPQEPKNENSTFNISINYNGKIFSRKFNSYDKIGDIINFVKSEIPTFSEIQLFTTFPRKIFDDKTKTFIQAGLSKAEVIMAKIL